MTASGGAKPDPPDVPSLIPSQLPTVEALRRPLEFTLAPVVGMRDRQAGFLPRCDRHLERVAHEGLAHVAPELPAHDPSREDVKHDGHVAPPPPGADIGEVHEPDLVRTGGGEVTAHKVFGSDRVRPGHGRTLGLRVVTALDAVRAHQSLDGAAGDLDALVTKLIPYLELAVDAPGLLVDTDDLGEQVLVAQDTRRRRLHASGAVCAR